MRVFRVLRGGSYVVGTWPLRTSDRDRYGPEYRGGYVGFRLVVIRKKK